MKILTLGVLALLAGTADAGTIYLCKSYSGAMFWAAAHCNQYNAFIDRIESVPDDIPWNQKVQQAEQVTAARSRDLQAPANGEAQRAQRCGQLMMERQTIEGRYSNWQWQPPEVINPDQQRMRALRAELSANRCATQ